MYRNNILLTFSDFNGEKNLGIYKKKKTREVIKIDYINFINNSFKIIGNLILNLIKKNNYSIYNYEKNDGIFNHLTIRNNEKNEILLEFYINDINLNVLNKLKYLNWNNYNVISIYYQLVKNKNNSRKYFYFLYGNRFLKYNIFNYTFSICSGCFFQTNNQIINVMYKEIYEKIEKNKDYIFLDLYCGVGIMSILLSKYFKKCIGIEINKNSIKMANYNKISNNCEFILGEVENTIENIINNIDYNNFKIIIFINPSRRGIYDSVIKKINNYKYNIKQILYLSCYEKSLNRDLLKFNFKNKLIKKYNMFPNTVHSEFLVELY